MKRKEYNSGSLPEACSCGSAASDTSGREGRKEERQNDRKKESCQLTVVHKQKNLSYSTFKAGMPCRYSSPPFC